MSWPLIWLLLRVIVPLSFVTIGGGASIIADLERQSVIVHHWMTASQFLDLFAISRAAPGPGSLLVSLVGFNVDGVIGAIVASLAIFVPTSLVLYVLARIWRRYRDASWQQAVERGLSPVAAGLILAGVYSIFRIAEGGIMAWIVAITAFVALRWLRANPFALLALGGVIFAVVGSYWWPA
ncbi:MAG: chromate transporter [Vulcanimicrobiaceae bacterium]|jgi:chromate transporter